MAAFSSHWELHCPLIPPLRKPWYDKSVLTINRTSEIKTASGTRSRVFQAVVCLTKFYLHFVWRVLIFKVEPQSLTYWYVKLIWGIFDTMPINTLDVHDFFSLIGQQAVPKEIYLAWEQIVMCSPHNCIGSLWRRVLSLAPHCLVVYGTNKKIGIE